MSPVLGFCIITSVAQPANKHAAAIINIGYRNGLASFRIDSRHAGSAGAALFVALDDA
jgi:hypothetical protein